MTSQATQGFPLSSPAYGSADSVMLRVHVGANPRHVRKLYAPLQEPLYAQYRPLGKHSNAILTTEVTSLLGEAVPLRICGSR